MSKEFIQQLHFELNIARELIQNVNNDDEYLDKMQDHLNKRYGMIEKKKYKLFSRSTYYKVPERFPILDTLKKAKRSIKKDNMRRLFWSKDFNNTEIERQWERDLSYVTKFIIKRGGGNIPDDFRWEAYIMHKRKNDENIIEPNAYIFIISAKSYKHFKRKVEDKKLAFACNVSPNLNDFVKPSAPIL